jgi:Big-like domain-containing protein/invasin-like protein
MTPKRAPLLATVLAAGLVTATCKLDKLITPPSSGLLSVAPVSLSDSAPLGSSAAHARAIAIANSANGRLQWTAATTRGSTWLTLSAPVGTAPDTLTVTLDPTGLAAADYRDTILVTATGSSAGQLRVPILFRVQPCGIIPITIGSPVAGTLSAASCAAPHRPGHAAQLFSFSGAAGDSITLELSSAAVNAYLILDSVLATPPAAENNDCPGAGTDACLPYQRLLRSGTFVVEATTAAPGSFGAFGLLLSRPRAPAAPDTLVQLLADSASALGTGGTTAQAAVVLRGVVSDPDRGDSLRLEVEVRPLSVAFTGTGTGMSAAVANGQRALVRVSVSDDSSYHWRARAVDQTGRSGPWTDFNAGGAAFHVAVPQPPAAIGPAGQFARDSLTLIATGGTADTSVVVLKAVVTDPDPGDQLRLQVEVRPAGTPFGTNTPTDSSAVVTSGATAAIRVGGLSDGVGYHWQARVADQTGRAGPWTSFGGNAESAADFTVRVAHAPSTPTALGQFKSNGTTAISVGGTTNEGTVIFNATVSDPDAADSLRLAVEVKPIGVPFTNTPDASSQLVGNGGQAAVTIGGRTDNTAYHWQARTRDNTERVSPWVSFGANADTAADFKVALPVSSLAFTGQPSTAAAGAAIAPAVTVTALDGNGQPITSFTGTVTVALQSNAGGATLSGTTSVAAVNGVATFTDLSLDKVGTGYTLQASVASVSTASAAFSVTPGPAANVVFSVQPLTTIAGAAITPAVQVTARDGFGNTATGFTGNVTIALAGGSGATLSGVTTVAAAAGVARFDSLVIDKSGSGYTLTASAPSLAGATSNAFDVTPSSANRLTFEVQPSTVTAGAAVSPPVQVAVRDANNNVVTAFAGNVTVTLGVNPGGGTLSGDTTVAVVAGIATFSNLHVDKAAAGYQLAASSPATGSAASVSFTVTPGPASQLAFTTQPSPVAAGAAIAPAIVVTARDALGNTATSFNDSVTVAIGANAGGGTLSGTRKLPAVSGVATFADLSLDKVGTGYTLSAAAAGLAGATSGGFNVTPGAASQLAFTVQPSNATAGAAIAPAVQVTARDAHGNTATGFSGTVTVAIGANPGGGTLAGLVTVAASQGVATFSDLSVDKADAGYTLTAGATGVAGATSGTFTIAPGVASALVFTGQPSATTAGAAISPAVQVTAHDALGNTATGFVGSVTIGIVTNPGGGTLSGTATVAASAGVATFPGLSIDKAGAGYTLSAAASGVSGASSTAFDVTPGAAAKLVFTVQPAGVIAGAAIAPAVQVTAQDAQGNTDPTFTGNVTVAIGTNAGGGTLAGTTTLAAVSGVASFANLSIDKAGAGYTLTAVAGGATGTTSDPFTVAPGAASQLAFTVQPTGTSAGAVLTPAVQVTAKDAQGNVATGFTGNVTVAIGTNPGGSTLGGTTTIAAVSGVATFGNLVLNKSGAGYTLAASSGVLASATSDAFTITPASATRLVFTVQPTSTVAGVTIAPAVQVTLQDTLQNIITTFGGNVTLAVGNAPGVTLGGTTTVAAVSGTATFSDLSVTKAGTGYTLTATASGAAAGASAPFTISPAAAAKLAFTQQPASATAGATIAPPVQVTAFDAFDNAATAFTGSVSVAIGVNPGGSTLSGTATTSAASGVAAFSGLSLDKVGTGYTLLASTTSPGVTGATSAPFPVVAGSAVDLVFTRSPASATAGHAMDTVLVRARDAQGNLATGFSGAVTIGIGTGPAGGTVTGATSVLAAGGVATFTNLVLHKAGGYTLSASATALAGATSAAITVTPDSAVRLVFTGQPSSVTAGAAIAPAVVVTAQDADSNVATGYTGSVTVALGTNPFGALMTGTKIVSAVAGVATYSTLTLDRTGTGYTLIAAAPGLISGGSGAFTVTPAAATQLVFTAQPATTVAGAALPAVQVTARDAFGNTAAGFGGSVTAAISGGTGTAGAALRGTKTVLASGGIATLTGLSIDSAGTGYTLSATSGGLTAATSASFAITAGAATHLVFAVPPGAVVAGAAISPAVQVAAKDSVGNTDPTFTASVSVAIGTNPAGGTLSGTSSGSAVLGLAAFGGLSLNKSGAGYTLTAATPAPGVTGAASAAFTVSPGAAAQLVFSVQPSNATAGVAITPAIQVTAQDALGNTATSFSDSVAVAIGTNAGGGTLGGTRKLPAVSGVATFPTLSIDKAGTGYTLTGSSGALTPAASTAFTISAGAAATLAITGGNAQADTIGATLTAPLSVKVTDANGNAVSGTTVTWAGSGGATPSASSTSSDAAGLASVTLTLGLSAGAQGASATATGLTGSPAAFTATATHGHAATVAKHGGDGQSATAGSAVPVAPSAIVTDRGGNPVPGIGVTFATAAGNGSVSPTTPIPTDGGGIAQVTSWTLSATAKPDTLTATSAGLAGSPLVFTATAFSGAATTIALAGGDAQTDTIGATLAVQYSVLVTDNFGNPVSGVPISWSASGGSITASSLSDGAGIARATRVLGTTAGAQTAAASAGGLTGSPVTFTATATHGAAAGVSLAGGNSQSDTIGATLPVPYTVFVTDRGSNPVSGVTVTWAAAGGGSITASSLSDGGGIAAATRTLGAAAGAQTASATAAGLTGSPVAFSATATAGNATTIALAGGNNQTDTVGATLAVPYTVLVTDRAANPVAGVTVTWGVSGGGTITPSSISSAGGIAGATRILGTAAGAQGATATAAGLAGSPVAFTATATSGGAKNIALSAGDAQTDTIGATLATPLSVLVTDAASNPVSGVTVNWAGTGGASVSAPSSLTNGSGIASIALTLGATAGAQGATAAAAGLSGSPVSFTATAAHGNASQLSVNAGQGQTATVGTAVAVAPAAAVRDRGGNPVPGVAVTFAVTAGGGAVDPVTPVATDGAGVAAVTSWTLGTTAGANTLTATATGLTGSPLAFTATATAGPATQIALNAGNAQSATVGTAVATAPSVIVRDQHNNPVAGVAVTFAVLSGGGAVLPATPVLTDAAGIAAATSWTLGTTAGPDSLTATATGLTGSPVAFGATATAGAVSAATSTVSAAPGTITASSGGAATTITVTAKDQFGNLVGGATVSLAATGTGNTLVQPAAPTAANGQATGTLSSTKAEAKTVSATVNGTLVTQTAAVSVGAAAASADSSHVVAAPTSITASSGGATSVITVTSRDGFGNPRAGDAVTLAATGTGNTVVQPANPTDATGVTTGTFSSTKAETKTLSATIGGSVLVTQTATVTVGAGAQVRLKFIAPPATTTAGAVIHSATGDSVAVAVADSFGNPVSGGGTTTRPTVTLSILSNPASGTLSGTTVKQVPNVNPRVVRFGTLNINKAGVGYTLLATSDGSQHPDTSPPFTILAGAATALALNGGSGQTDTVGATLAVPYTVKVTDAGGNAVSGVTVTWAASSGSITASSVTDAGGIASATRVLGTTAGAQTASATVTGLIGSPVPFSATATPGAATAIAANAGDGQSATVNSAVTTAPSVVIHDQFGNPVPGVAVTFAVASGGGAVVPTSPVTTNASGVAAVTSWTLGTVAGANTLTATATGSGITGNPVTVTATGTPGAPSALAFLQQPTNATAGVAITPSLTVEIRDAFGNRVTTATNSVAMAILNNAGGGTLSGTTPRGAAAGVATFDDLSIDQAGTGYTLQATSGVLTGVTSSAFDITAGGLSTTASTIGASAGEIAASNGASSVTITVTAKDAHGNPIAGASVALAATGSGNSLTQPAGTTNASGVATGTFSSTVAEAKTISATVNGSGLVQTVSISVAPAAATQLTFGTQPTTATAGAVIAPAVVVRAHDPFGNLDTTFAGTVTLAITGGTGTTGATLSGTTTVTAAAGVATFSDLSIDSAGTGYTLDGTAGGLTPATSTAFDIVPGAVAQLVWVQQPTTTAVSTVISPAPSLRALDALGNLVSTFTGSVTIAIAANPGTGVLGGTLTLNAVGGIATFGDLTIDTAGDGYTLQATTGGVTSAPSAAFSITP